jgi:hypothetical protein
MKKLIFFVLLLISIAGRSSAQGPIVLTDYRPLAEFGTDTLAYVQNNWGIHSKSTQRYHGKTFGDFFNDYELPIIDIGFQMDSDNSRLVYVGFYFRSLEHIKRHSLYEGDYCVGVQIKWPEWGGEDPAPTYTELAPIFNGKGPQNQSFPWREEYRELMKDWLIQDVLYQGKWW